MKNPFQISVNQGQYSFEMEPETAQNLDVVPNGDGKFHVLKNGKSYQAELISADFDARSMQIRVNGRQFSVHIADQYERLLKQLGLTVGGFQKMNMVKAPMPGLVLQILVEAGQKVEKGDQLLILEAMKMENVLKATGEGVVKSVKITNGQAVEKGAVLLEME
jgi:biotin carboxyl carrier protein